MLLHLHSSLFHNLLKTRKRQNGQTLFNVTKVTGVAFIWRTRKVKCYVSESRETKSYRETQPKTDERAIASIICTHNTIGIRVGRY